MTKIHHSCHTDSVVAFFMQSRDVLRKTVNYFLKKKTIFFCLSYWRLCTSGGAWKNRADDKQINLSLDYKCAVLHEGIVSFIMHSEHFFRKFCVLISLQILSLSELKKWEG